MAQADMVTMSEISASGRDAARKFWRYLGTLNGREQCLTILDEDTGQPTERLGQCLTDHLVEVFSPPEAAPLQDLSPTEDTALTPDDATCVTIGRVSLTRALAHIKNNTAQGLDKIPASVLKALGRESRDQLADIFENILSGTEGIPRDWRGGRVVLIPKKGCDSHYLRHYRPLTVTSTVYRTFAYIMKEHMTAWAEEEGLLTGLQGGFRRERRLEDHLYTLTQCIEDARREKRNLICCFLDIAKAYDSVPHARLVRQLQDLNMRPE